MEKQHLFVFTDYGVDVDDALALAYINGCPDIALVGVCTSHHDTKLKAAIVKKYLSYFGLDVPVAAGIQSQSPPEEQTFLEEIAHRLDAHACPSLDSEELWKETLKQYPNVSVAILSPLTDACALMGARQKSVESAGRIYLQGRAQRTDRLLIPNLEDYNFREQVDATVQFFALYHQFSMTLMGKNAAYQVPIDRDDFQWFEKANPFVGKYLRYHAELGQEFIRKNANPPLQRYKDENFLSFPYDPLTVMSFSHPEFFPESNNGQFHIINNITNENQVQHIQNHLVFTITSGIALKHLC